METVVQFEPVIRVTDDQFFEFCQLNRDMRIERNAKGGIVIMPPAGGDTGRRNAEIALQLGLWAKRDGTGTTFDSSTGFSLPDKAVRSPDAAWVSNARLALLSDEEKKRFLPLCPDFLIELRFPSDYLYDVQNKMHEYRNTGALLGWLIDPEERRVYIYRPHLPIEELEDPDEIAGGPELPGFTLDLREIW